ncbi:amino acid adenylation domain-containing protein [Entomomonas moraniae]|uniref:Amino acid adenylation domain-containing protein n=1 Tax=Entomomonas moraniae TaxID=2213226 RepID=A0A3S9XDI6_9GAMM|nr:non-ribosomal peptide synthetase [Entomomonas moraniae]AZS50492.1 amino acid adenylation domain-containing protein [Entomomonas moraniae]
MAYAIYTSGTTGNPKGTLIEHHNVNRLVVNANYVSVDESDRFLSISGYQFDASTYDLFAALFNGAATIIATKDNFLNLAVFNQLLADYEVTNFFATAAFFNTLVDAELPNLARLRYALAGGEALSAAHVNRFLELYPQVKVVNGYGPTETTTFAVTYLANQAAPFDHSVPIGVALSNTALYILDEQLEPVPMGAIGELYIGGAGVGRGYLNNPELTRKVFLANPFQTAEEKAEGYNDRLYKTGDLVRYLPNGNIEYIGRNDFQVKIRGFRIELSEIESRLIGHPLVKQAAVLALTNANGGKYLAAYYVADSAMTHEALSSYLQQFLPEYMVPTAFVYLSAFPLNMNGKLDRKALPVPELINTASYIAPTNPTETIFCQLFANILRIDEKQIGIEDDFFKLGGDSISSIQLANRVRQNLGYYLSIKDIFNYRTIKGLSDYVIKNQHNKASQIQSEQGILAGDITPAPIQQWFFNNVTQGKYQNPAHWNQAFLIKVPQLNHTVLQLSIEKLVEYHDILRATYSDDLGYYQQSLPLAFDILNVEKLSVTDIEQQLTQWQDQFNLNDGPLYHIGYLEGYADNIARIHVAVHHLNIDAVSWRIIKHDLQAIYEYFTQQATIDETISAEKILGAKSTSYRQWVMAQQNYSSKKSSSHEKAYWQNLLADFEGYQQHINQYRTNTVHKLQLTLPKEQTTRLLREANKAYHTSINDLLLTVLAKALTTLFNTPEHYVLLEGHGREKLFDDIDINNTVGWFTCMYPVKLCAQQGESVHNLIAIKDSLRSIPERGLGYGILMGYTQHPLPSVCFNYLGQFDGQEDIQWSFSHESSGIAISANNRMTDFLSLNGGILNGQLQFNVEGYLAVDQLHTFNDVFTQQLNDLIDQLTAIDRSYLTRSDINDIISRELLDKLQTSNEVEAIYPANSLQQGFIYHAVAQGQSDSAYRIQLIWDYHNPMDAEAFKKAWQISQANYPALRSRFSWDEEFIQVIDKQSSFAWALIDLSEQTPAQQLTSLEEIIQKDHQINYDLSQGQLFRIYLIKLADAHYQCLFNNHHTILDGWSVPVLLNNVHQNYLSIINQKPIVEQTDHCYLATQAFLQQKAAETEAFWNSYLSSPIEPESLDSLLKDESRHINLSDHKFIVDHQERSINFTGRQAEQLKAFCRKHDFTINALMQYCWHQQLSLHGNTKTTTVGMTVSGRNLPIDGIETSVGLYINTLPVTLNHEDGRIIDTIKLLQTHINNVNNHSNINLTKLQRSGTRLFNSLFVFENYPISETHNEQIKLTFKEGKEKLDYPLGIVAFENAQQITLKIKYAGELFSEQAIERVLQGINLTLKQLLANPMVLVKELQLITAEEYHHLIKEQTQTVIPFPKHKLVNQLFEEQVQKTPDAWALVYEDIRFTYQELNDYANQLAHYLITTLETKPDDLIGLYLDKSEHMAIAILAILKAGAAYVPMSPQAPVERIQHMVNDTNAKAILTNAVYQDYLNQLMDSSNKVIAIDAPTFTSKIVQGDKHNPITQTQSNHLAYIIYTSGTTGNPKGVMIEHHSLINMATLQQDILNLNPKHGQKNVLWYSSYVFDAHAFELYNSLLNGHCLHILTEEKRLNFNALSDYITDHRIDLAFIPPALLDKNELLSIPILAIGGESANPEVVNQYCQHETTLINLYGPTETTIWATTHPYQKVDISNNIGKANKNFYLYILDEHFRPVPQGVKGELYIGGFGVGRGYLNNTELTNRVFIANPFQSAEEKAHGYNDRLYKTGDLVRYLANGDVEYIGRNDFQVKIRGFRIELGEIEARLASHPEIKQTLVMALSNSLGTKYLAAYYVAKRALSQESLVEYLQQFLPDYMLPSAFVHLTAMPISINGKIDRKALPTPSLVLMDTYIAPTTSTEKTLADLFAELLGLTPDQVSTNSDFFGLGGDSILAIKLSSKIGKVFNKTVPINEIFTKRTIQALAIFLDEVEEGQQRIIAPVIQHPEEQRLSFAQERLWFIESYENGSNAYNIPLVFKLAENTDYNAIEQALTEVVNRHEILRSVIKTNVEGAGYQRVINLQENPLVINHQVCESKIILDNYLYNHAHKIFILDQELPISINRYLLDHEYYISIVIHHIAFDGWSTDLLIKELIQCYQQITQQQPINLAPVDVQYKDFALWQRHYLQGDVLAQQLQYWQQQLGDYEPLNLPTDYPRPAQVNYDGMDMMFELGSELSHALRTIAAESKVSLYTVLLSGYYLLLSAFSNQRDIVIGTPIAGRHHQGIENTIGFFVNMLALRTSINPEDSLQAFIEQTSQHVLDAQKYQDLPFEKLVDSLQLEKDASRHPIFQVMFGVQSFASPITSEFESLFTPYKTKHAQYQPAKFDITTLLDDSQPSITGVFNYATSLFSEQTIAYYISVYQHILEQIVTLYKKQQSIAELQLLTPNSHHQVITQWNQTRCSYPTDATIPMLFEQQVQRTPENTAVIYEQESITYQALNAQANQLAYYLRANFAIQPDDFVALCLDRSKHMPISILAILKAGGAYVPMDPQAPDDRIVYMLNDTKAKVILTTHKSYEKIKALVNPEQTVINLQDEDNIRAISHYPVNNLPHLAKPHHLAYVIYTSGTTGNPKGVMLEHQGVVNRINWMHKQYPITEQDHILQKTNYTFDVSVWELFWAHWYGACIVFANSELYKDNVYLAQLIESEKITVLHFVPSMLVAFIETLEAQPELQLKVQSLKYIFCSGEALNLYEVKKCQQLIPSCEIHNLYGPTEATVDVLYYDCNNPDIKQVLIGKPIDNTSAYVLNELLQPVPIGGIGELYVGGDGLARGYLNNPTLTQERFITNPFQTLLEQQQNYNGRIYKTGDLVRSLADGNIQYLGRNDFQVKIRGFRIELGEIEARLTLYPAINYCVVIAYEQASGSKYLVAYYVAAQSIDEQLLSRHLHETLPSYMIPSAFIHLTELPITSNGKLNRKALPKPELTDKVEYIAPENMVEITLCDIFASILKISASEISMADNFFKLGGNSILAMMLNNRINEAFQIKLRLVDILNTQTIRELAQKIANTQQLFNPVVSLNTAINKPVILMIHPGIGGCDVYSALANKLTDHYQCQGIDSYNFYHENKIDDLYVLTQYYLNHIQKILALNEPIILLGWSLGGHIALEMATYFEALGINNIKVYLLDTWLLDKEDIANTNNPIELAYAMKELNIPDSLKTKVESLAEIDSRLVVQPLSAVLEKTQIVLFKATQAREHSPELYEKYPYNNIDRYIHSPDQLRVVELNCDHYQIINQESIIINHLIELVN